MQLRKSIALALPILLLLAACDTFAPPPKRRPNQPPMPSTTSGVISTVPAPTSTVSPACTGLRLDRDRDGFTVPDCPPGAINTNQSANDDCDDFDANIHQGQALYIDRDGDGLGNSSDSQWVCAGVQLFGWVEDGSDCLDTDATKQSWVAQDSDGDGFGGTNAVCGMEGEQWVVQTGDCAENDPTIYPEALEVPYDGVDTNCDLFDVEASGVVDDPGAVITWDNPICAGGVLAIVAIESGNSPPGGVWLQIGNIGTEPVTGATLVVNKLITVASFQTVLVPIPSMNPGDVVRTERINAGQYEVTIEGASSGSTETTSDIAVETTTVTSDGSTTDATVAQVDAAAADGAVVELPLVDAAGLDAAVTDAGLVSSSVAAPDAHATENVVDTTNGLESSSDVAPDSERCARAQQPFKFTSTLLEAF